MTVQHPFDPGLQPERTLLAWQRTVLALAVGAVVGMRLTAPAFGGAALVAGLIGLALSLAAYVGVRFRYRRAQAALQARAALPASSAWPLAALAAGAVSLGVLALFYLGGGIRLTQ
ncbi:DUF202 domain-containing protein [Cryobacterium cryoconiti]|uniref:DUF202 domain-containing protein n=1 Tax=Cryobacterium cryoconiti TaxID=1259239 RepID=UPI00141BE0E9|nr:DUF202 domain-containing protein [Cryobacterium cryoconiti]